MEKIDTSTINMKQLLSYFFATMYSGILLLLVGVILHEDEIGLILLILGVVSIIVGSVFSLICLHRIWGYIINQFNLQGFAPPIERPGQAVGYLFIPFYNFYWVFIAYGQIPKCLNKLNQSRNSDATMPDSLGTIIGIFSASSIIPFLGTALSIISSFILLPILLHKSVNAIIDMPPVNLAYSQKNNKEIHESIEISKTRDLMQLLQAGKQSFNIILALYLVAASFVANIAQSMFTIFGYGFDFKFLAASLAYIIPFSVYAFICALLLSVIKNRHILAVLFGAVGVFLQLTIMLISYINIHSLGEIISTISGTYIIYISIFVNGIVLIYGLSLGIKLWGYNYWSILFANGLTYILPFIGGVITAMSTEQINVYQLAAMPIIKLFIYSSAYYFGLKWNLPTADTAAYTPLKERVIDSNL